MVLGSRFCYLLELKHIRWSEFCPDNCFHPYSSSCTATLIPFQNLHSGQLHLLEFPGRDQDAADQEESQNNKAGGAANIDGNAVCQGCCAQIGVQRTLDIAAHRESSKTGGKLRRDALPEQQIDKPDQQSPTDRKSTRLNSSHVSIS